MDDSEAVKLWLTNNYGIKVSSEWLSACLEWIAQENEGISLPLESLKQQVFEQWLTSDLSEIGEPIIPADLCLSDKVEFKGSYALQILSIVDVGSPLYGQQQKLTGRENSNETVSAEKTFQAAWEPKPSRMLFITLTDGFKEVKAIEYQPIRSLHPQLPSGSKCLITGPALCRHGVVFLQEGQFQYLGGEVDTLSETNTPLAVLQQAMTKNREDEGKTAKKELSGRFIKKNSDKHLEFKRSNPKIKKEDVDYPVSQTRKPALMISQPRSAALTHCPAASAYKIKPEIKNENLKGTTERSNCVFLDEWEDDINYSDLLDDNMDFEDAPPKPPDKLSSNLKNNCDQAGSKRFHVESALISSSDAHDLSTAVASSNVNSASGLSSCREPELVHGVMDNDVFDDDDEDFEMEAEFNCSSSSWKPSFKASSGEKCKDLKQENNPMPSSFVAKENLSQLSASGRKQKPVCPQISPPAVSRQSVSPTFTSPVSYKNQSLSSKSAYIKEEPSTGLEQSSSKSDKCSQAKRQKVQTKVSDLFRKKSLKTETSSKSINSDSFRCEDVTKPLQQPKKSPCQSPKTIPLTKSGVSADLSVSTSISTQVKEPAILHSTVQASLQDLKSTPKAVIQPFKVLDEEDDSSDNICSTLDALMESKLITVKASILTLIEKLCSNNGSHWSLACRVSDGRTSLDVDISNEVLVKLIGFSAEDSVTMRQRFKSEPKIKQVFAEGLSQCQNKLISGRSGCVLEIESACSNPNNSRPVIKKFTPMPS